jgi:hypothetical protein
MPLAAAVARPTCLVSGSWSTQGCAGIVNEGLRFVDSPRGREHTRVYIRGVVARTGTELNTKHASLLTVIAAAITTLAASYIVVGPALFIELAIVSSLALACWLRFSFREPLCQDKIVAPFIQVVVLNLILNTSRYWSNHAQFLNDNLRSLFALHFAITDVSWFIVFVTCPVSLMLVGGFYLSNRLPIGFYLAWWTFLYAIADAIVQFSVEFAGSGKYHHEFFVGAVAASAQMIVSVIGCQRLLGHYSTRAEPLSAVSGMTLRQMNLWTALVVSLVAIYAIALYQQAGLLPVGVIAGSMMGGIIGWRKTTAQSPADPYKVVPLYLLLLALFYVHVGEESLTSFNQAIAAITGTLWPDREFTFLIALIGPAVWVVGALSLWRRKPFGNFVLWFMIVGMILGEPTHLLVFPVVAMYKFGGGYQYFSGMYTALFPMIPAIMALVTIIKDHKERGAPKSHV